MRVWRTALLVLVWLGLGLPAAAQDRAYLWPDDPPPSRLPHGLLLLGPASPAQRQAAIRGFLAPLGAHDLPQARSEVALYVPVVPDARAAATGIPTAWNDHLFLERHWDAARDAALRESLGLTGGPLLLYRTAHGDLIQDLSAAAPFWVRHWILAYRRAVATAPSVGALAQVLRTTLPDAPVSLSRR